MSLLRTRWAAVGAAVAITLGAGGIGLVNAAKSTGARAVYTAIEPCRLLDTRPGAGIGGRTTPLGVAETYPLTAHGTNGECVGIPADTVALELNVTGLLATGVTFFTIWDGQGAVPNASHLNLTAGHGPTPNSVTTELHAGTFAIYNDAANAHAIIDIVGIYQDHNHDDRYDTKAELDARFSALTGDEIVDGSLTLSDLAGAATQTRTVQAAVDVPAGECRSLGGGNSGSQEIGKLALFTIADSGGNAVIPNGATAVPSVVIGTSQGGAIIQFLVCNGRTSSFTVPAGAVVTYRLVDP